ncbi:uncharacterized protein LOC113291609 [Papaver somniferum]|uniref:uncharacterized protein LOC113291609 n=1 Tax=Papaver somniferum TaxID=3469 RepID=UPI000E6F9AB7|nr:uncharacterized protein LOC113291609 [Papaver somniferum]
MGSLYEGRSFQKKSYFPSMPTTTRKLGALPISRTNSSKEQHEEQPSLLRRRLPSFSSLDTSTIQQPFSTVASTWALHRSKFSTASMGGYAVAGSSSIKKWWDWGWAWMLSRKPTFASDLEMDEQEYVMLGSHNKGTLRHVFCKVKSQVRRLVGSEQYVLPIGGTSKGFR